MIITKVITTDANAEITALSIPLFSSTFIFLGSGNWIPFMCGDAM